MKCKTQLENVLPQLQNMRRQQRQVTALIEAKNAVETDVVSFSGTSRPSTRV